MITKNTPPYNMAQIVYGHALGLDSGKDNLAGIPFSAKECVFSSQLQLLAYRMVGYSRSHRPRPLLGRHERIPRMDGHHGYQNKDILAGQIEMKTPRKYIAARTRPTPSPFPKRTNTFPCFFTNPFNRDVTDKYLHTSDVTVSATVPCRHATPISPYSTGGNSGSSTGATCNKTKPAFTPWVPTSCISPVYFEKEYQRNFAYPFILRANGTTVTLRPDTTRRQTLTLTRKYPLHHHKVYHGNAPCWGKVSSIERPNIPKPRNHPQCHPQPEHAP